MRTVSTVATVSAPIRIIHDASIGDVSAFELDPGLTSIIRRPTIRRTILRDLAAAADARLTLAVSEQLIIGHAAAGPSFGRWRELPRVREVAFEVSRAWRHTGIATRMTEVALADPAVEDEIQLAFLWPSAWDTEFAGLTRSAYRDLLTTFVERYGFRPFGTDEPEVMLQAGARLLARIGARVPRGAVAAFTSACYLNGNRRQAAA